MQTYLRNSLRMTAVFLLVAALLGVHLLPAHAASLPATPCTGTGTVTCNLWAKSGSFTPPAGAVTTIWGYTASAGAALAAPGGPVLIVNQGDTVTVNLVNNLSVTTSMFFQGQSLKPDTVGVGPGGSTSYTFVASDPGTYLYEAGLAPNSQPQVAMGLYGALVVRPSSPNQAYADASTFFNEETVLVLSEMDTALNNNANPAGFDMRNFKPKYFLINGQPYPATAPIEVAAARTVLLRYVNAGLQSHPMTLLGFSQKVIATDGNPLAHAYSVSSETIAPGQTLDALVNTPATVTNGSQFALYDANMLLRNNTGITTSAGFGGMLTFLTISNSTVINIDTTGPLSSVLTLTPNQVGGTAVDVSIGASVSDTVGNIAAAEYFIDATGANGSGQAMSGSFGSSSAAVSATIPAATTGALSAGNHTVYVHGQDSNGNWGAFTSAILRVDLTGPATTGLGLTPNPSSGAANVTLSATGNDTGRGGSNVTAAEYFIDPVGTPVDGSGIAMTGAFSSVNVSATAVISSTTLAGLSEGAHLIAVHSRDSANNWGLLNSITLTIDRTGPITGGVLVEKSPNNGSLPYNASTQAVHVSASFADATGTLSMAEGFIGIPGPTGTGFLFIANDGVFNSASESGYTNIPLATIAGYAAGSYTINIHARDASGNWGDFTSGILVIDRTAPTTSGLVLTPPASNNTAVAISASASDVSSGNSNIGAAEFFLDAVGVSGSGTALTLGAASPATSLNGSISAATIAGLTVGSHTVYVHAKDIAGNWGATISTPLIIDRTAPTFSGISLSPAFALLGTSSVTLNVNGSNDGAGGSGVAGGEYWFGTTNPAPGGGTAFSGLTPSIPTGALSAGAYVVRARVRDAAGNWSTGTNGVRSATLTIVLDSIFANGFESGSLPGSWSSRSTSTTARLNATGAAALAGSFGLQAQGNNTNYVQYNFGTPSSPPTSTYDARFYFNPHGNTGTNQDIFSAATSSGFGSTLFRIRYRWNGGTPQVQLQLGTSNTNATWSNITTGSNALEVVWQAAGSGGPNPGTLRLYINGALAQSLNTTSTSSVSAVRMGSITSGGSATLEYFDAFVSKRSVSTLVGP